MKKFVIMADHGLWENYGGKTVIHCEVLDTEIFAEFDTMEEAFHVYQALKSTYAANGVWTNYSIEKRAAAKKQLARYHK